MYKIAKRLVSIILPIFLALAILGSFATLKGEVLRSADNDAGKLGSAGFCPAIIYTFDWLAENTTINKKELENSLSVLRNGFIRVFTFAGTYSTVITYSGSYFLAIKNDETLIKKDTIPLKLRI